jgi:hypothetical protein
MKKLFGKKSELSLNFNTNDTIRTPDTLEVLEEDNLSNSMI